MKSNHRLFLLAALLAPWFLSAQSVVPQRISYQGIVTDVSDNLVGDPTPENRTVTFRIWNNPTAKAEGNLIYSEAQVVTIAKGEFSVLIGAGAEVSGTPLGFSESTKGPGAVNISGVWTYIDRYLGVTVDDGDAGTVDVEISPRQQIVTTAFAFRAKEAETVINGSITTDALANGSITLNKIGSAAVNSNTIVDSSIVTQDISNGAISAAKLGSDVGLWSVAGANVYRSSGNVGIRNNNPTMPLDVGGDARVGNNLFVNTNIIIGANLTDSYLRYESDQFAIRDQTNTLMMNFNNNGYIDINKPLSVDGNVVANGGPGYGHTFSGDEDSGLFWPADNELSLKTAGVERVRIDASGRVGIGTNSPTVALDVGGDARVGNNLFARANLLLGRPGYDPYLRYEGNNFSILNSSGQPRLNFNGFHTNFSNALFVNIQNGSVGVGTSASGSRGKLEVLSGPLISHTGVKWEYGTNASYYDLNTGTYASTISIWAENSIVAPRFITFSDERIKEIVGLSNGSEDLSNLQRLEITDYRYIDTLLHGTATEKKVIAQQVESVLPQAVRRSTDVVPDIYQNAAINHGWVELETDLEVGERVRLITETEEGIHEVLEVSGGAFRTAFQPEGDVVFVYGREVDDFRSVDYNALSMLNVSATQELARRLETSEANYAQLKHENTMLSDKLSALDAKLAAIELLLATDTAAAE